MVSFSTEFLIEEVYLYLTHKFDDLIFSVRICNINFEVFFLYFTITQINNVKPFLTITFSKKIFVFLVTFSKF